MPRRRPPGAGPGLRKTTALLAVFLVLPWISTAAQQQQPSHHVRQRSPAEGASIVDAIPPDRHRQPSSNGRKPANASKRNTYTPLISENERAVATKVSSAPADFAVRAPHARNAASSGGLTPKSARSLRDWEVEDFVLLATVDGRIHARDRYNGNAIWTLDIPKPMLKTTFNHTSSDSHTPQNLDFLWIVEPKEDGALYILTPGPQPVLSSLGMTVKQLAQDLAPYATDDPPVVYLADEKKVMLVVDARTGVVVRSFSTSGSTVLDRESCAVHKPDEVFDDTRRECTGFFNIGRIEYTITIQNRITGDTICTINYTEWIPNNRDKDLHAQYTKTLDSQYIYSRYDGHAIAMDHRRAKPAKRPVFEQKFDSPVVRVFDVVRPNDSEDPETTLVLLPQPPGPSFLEDKADYVWLNTTEEGSFYALSETSYPAVTDQAPRAQVYSPEWYENELLNMHHPTVLPDHRALVGVHILDHVSHIRPTVPSIDAPPNTIIRGPELLDSPTNEPENVSDVQAEQNMPKVQARSWTNAWAILFTLVGVGGFLYIFGRPEMFEQLRRTLLSKMATSQPLKIGHPTAAEAVPEVVQVTAPAAETPVHAVDGDSPAAKNIDADQEKKVSQEKTVRFEIPDDEEDMEPLSRTTTAEPSPPLLENGQPGAPVDAVDGQNGAPVTPTKKKKAHRGRRGGAKKKKQVEDADEVDGIVNAAKELEQTPSLHPDEQAIVGDDIQDVSNIKKIGKLTIDFDRLLGNGSGGTFVFEGKWNERVVAVKRMLPQYFGLAEQEVKLLQESDTHKNVIRYFDDEKDENFLYIAVEICQASLFDLYRDGRPGDDLTETQQRLVNEINSDVRTALLQLARGLHHLHSLRIIHRDIKPQNILIAYPHRNENNKLRLVISDFGLCKTLPDNVSTLIGTTGNAGTVGWKAPELILQPKDMDRGSSTGHSRDSSSSTDPVAQGVKRAVDIFSLGCVFFYVLTNGSHPFDDEEGWMQMRELNIKKNKANFDQLSLGDDSEEPKHLIQWMLSNRPEDRPTALEVLKHPFFWKANKRLEFLCDCSDHWERECRDPPSEHLSILESYSPAVIGDKKPDFLAKLNRSFVASLGKQRKYTGDRMLDLLRALRNKRNHYEDMDESVKTIVGPLPHGYLRYWTVKFPSLLMSCYEAVVECGLQGEPRFKEYFEPDLEG